MARLLGLLLFVVPIEAYGDIDCFSCSCKFEGRDDSHCVKPVSNLTQSKHCKAWCGQVLIEPPGEGLLLRRGCAEDLGYPRNYTLGGVNCTGISLCNDNPLNFTCYQCGYSSNGKEIRMNRAVFSGNDEDCLEVVVNKTKTTTDCLTRCMESYHTIKDGKVLFVRGCSASLNRFGVSPLPGSIYRECNNNMCNRNPYEWPKKGK